MFYIRHGQSTFNVAFDTTGIDPQIPDAPLAPMGIQQVERAAARLQGHPIERIISSPYTRALQTAHILAKELNVTVSVDPLVGERRIYSCDIGRTAALLKKEWPQADFAALEDHQEWWMPFHESAESLAARVKTFRDEWDWRDEAGRTLVVSHWYFLNAITGTGLDNAEIVKI